MKRVLRKQSRVAQVRRMLFLGSLAGTLLVGCRDNPQDLPLYPVQGSVQYKNKPLSHALVALHPVDKSDPRLTACRATTDVDGVFRVSSRTANDGAPAGKYAVTVESYKLVGNEGNYQPGPNVLPAKYARPDTTPLFIDVQAGGSEPHQLHVK